MKRTIILAVLMTALFSSCLDTGCRYIRGNGHITREIRDVGDFKGVEVHGSLELHVSQGERFSVAVEGDENLLKYISTETEGRTLVIGQKGRSSVRPTGRLRVHVTAPGFKSLDASGACSIIGDNRIVSDDPLEVEVSGAGEVDMEVDVAELKAGISGSGKMTLQGVAGKFFLDLSGAADADCFKLVSDDTRVDISGAGKADVVARRSLRADISGAGRVRYKGNDDTKVDAHTSGAGKVERMKD